MPKTALSVGDPVIVDDPGLAMLRQFAPPGAKPNNHGFVHEVEDEDGFIMVAFPIGDDDMDEHSQVAPYPASAVRPRAV